VGSGGRVATPQFRYHSPESWLGSESNKHERPIPSFCLHVLMGTLFAGLYNVCLWTSQLTLISVMITLWVWSTHDGASVSRLSSSEQIAVWACSTNLPFRGDVATSVAERPRRAAWQSRSRSSYVTVLSQTDTDCLCIPVKLVIVRLSGVRTTSVVQSVLQRSNAVLCGPTCRPVVLQLFIYELGIFNKPEFGVLSSPAQTLGSWVWIPLKAWMFVCVYSVFVL
jgi:hypothetical protein